MSGTGRRKDPTEVGPIYQGRFKRPPRRVRDRLRTLPSGEILTPARPEATHVFSPVDIRGADDQLSQGEEVVVTRSHEAADLTVTIRPPDAAGIWRVGGRVWLLQESTERLSAALMHGDHVLQSTRIVDGEYFELEDVLPRGWHLEIHLPEGVCARVEDPRQ